VIREFEFVFLTVGNPYRNGRRERISSSEAMIYQWTSLGLYLLVKKGNVPRPYTTPLSISCVEDFVVISCGKVGYDKSGWRDD
jgi:hypothetical protein